MIGEIGTQERADSWDGCDVPTASFPPKGKHRMKRKGYTVDRRWLVITDDREMGSHFLIGTLTPPALCTCWKWVCGLVRFDTQSSRLASIDKRGPRGCYLRIEI